MNGTSLKSCPAEIAMTALSRCRCTRLADACQLAAGRFCQRVGEKGQIVGAACSAARSEQSLRKRSRGRRQFMVKVLDEKISSRFVGFAFRRAPAPARNGRPESAPAACSRSFSSCGFPVDIEVGRIAAGGPVFENVPPIAIAASADRHVVRNDIQHLSQMARAEPQREPVMRFRSPSSSFTLW